MKPYKFFSNRILAAVGKCSFSMYLVHFALLGFMKKYDFKSIINSTNTLTAYCDLILMFLLLSVASFVISHFTYKLIEVPGQNLGRKIIKKLNIKNQ